MSDSAVYKFYSLKSIFIVLSKIMKANKFNEFLSAFHRNTISVMLFTCCLSGRNVNKYFCLRNRKVFNKLELVMHFHYFVNEHDTIPI